MALCPTCTADLKALAEEKAGLAAIITYCQDRTAEITAQVDAILDGKH